MRHLVLAVTLFGASSPAFAGGDERVISLGDAITREAERLARGENDQRSQAAAGKWSAVTRLEPGTSLLVTLRSGREYGIFVSADRDRLLISTVRGSNKLVLSID